jgi:hypothetical protein
MTFEQFLDEDGYCLEVIPVEGNKISFSIVRPGALSTRYAIALDHEDVQRLQLALAAHLHDVHKGASS